MANKLHIIHDLNEPLLQRPSVVTVGSFDGVHRGHQALLTRLRVIAEQEALQRVVVTFEPHPRLVLAPEADFQLLTPTDEKAAWLAHYGVEVLVVLPFDRAFAALSGEQFATTILRDRLHARVLVAGYNHRFGHDRMAAEQLQIEGLRVERVERTEVEGLHVSSSEIRRAIAANEIHLAEKLLGHPIQQIENR